MIAVVLGCLAASGGVILYARSGERRSRPAAPVDIAPPRVVPAPGQAFVTGTVERLVADGAQGGTITTPFTLTVPEQGGGGVSIEGALVGGRRTTIVWSGGTPLPLSGSGGLDLGGASLAVDADSVIWSLPDGDSRPLQPGFYRAAAPVAVGDAGLAVPQDGVAFSADATTRLDTRGRVVVREPASRIELTGPGRVSAQGDFRVVTDASTASASTVELADGPFRITLTPGGEGLALDAVLQGPLATR